MYFSSKDIIIDNKIVAKVFRYKKKKFSGIKFFTSNNLNLQLGLMAHSKNHLIEPHVHLNKKKILSARGKKFRGGHVYSIIKRKRARYEKLKEKYPEVRSDFYLDIYDKSILLSS